VAVRAVVVLLVEVVVMAPTIIVNQAKLRVELVFRGKSQDTAALTLQEAAKLQMALPPAKIVAA
jgi:hypothetical protein